MNEKISFARILTSAPFRDLIGATVERFRFFNEVLERLPSAPLAGRLRERLAVRLGGDA